MKYLCALFFVIGIVGSAPTGNRCVESCSNISVDDIINLIISRKIDVFSLLSKIQALVGSSTGGTGSSNHYEISGSFSPFTSVNAAGLAKLLSGLSNPTLAKVVDTITDFTGIELDTSEISPDNLNKPFDLTPLVKQLYSSNGPVSLRSILNAVQQAANSSPGTINGTGGNNNNNNIEIGGSFSPSISFDGPSLAKLLSGVSNPTLAKTIGTITDFTGIELDTSDISPNNLNKPFDLTPLVKQLYSSNGPVSLRSILNAVQQAANSSPGTTNGTGSNNNNNIEIGGSFSPSISFDGPTLAKLLSGVSNPTLAKTIGTIIDFTGIELDTSGISPDNLNKPFDLTPLVKQLYSSNGPVSLRSILNAVQQAANSSPGTTNETGGNNNNNNIEIGGSFSPSISFDGPSLAKLLSGVSNPTLAKTINTITDFTGIELDTSDISPNNLNKPFDLTPLVKQLYSSNGPVSLRSILNAVQQATNSSPGTTNETGSNNNDAIDGPSGTVGGNSNGVNLTSTSENTTLSDLFPADAKVNGTNLYKILSSAKKPTVSYFIQLLERFSGSTIGKSKFLSSILNKTLDSSVIEKLSAFSGNVPVKTLLSSLSLTSPSSSSSSSFSSSSNGSNGSSGTANQNGSGSSSVTFDGFVPADAKVNLKNLYKVLSSAKKPTVSFFFEILGKFSGLTIYTNKMPKSVLNQTLDSSFIEKLASLGETVSVQTALNILSVSLN